MVVRIRKSLTGSVDLTLQSSTTMAQGLRQQSERSVGVGKMRTEGPRLSDVLQHCFSGTDSLVGRLDSTHLQDATSFEFDFHPLTHISIP